jgi:[methyl-Co(III) methanol-specific corrinoid protein]:coenzyme M methyltransferase
MTELTPKERVMRVFRKEPVDTMPFFSGYGMVVLPAIQELGYRFAQVHTDAGRLVQSAPLSSRMFGFDSADL